MYVNKYQPQHGENITDANIPLIRLSETYLNAAEAAVKNGDASQSSEIPESHCTPRKSGLFDARTKVNIENVLDERRKELVKGTACSMLSELE